MNLLRLVYEKILLFRTINFRGLPFSAKVVNNQELDEALSKAANADCEVYIEVVTGKMAASEMAVALNQIVFKGGGWKE